MEHLQQMWHKLHIIDLKVANLCNLDKNDPDYKYLQESLAEERSTLIKSFEFWAGYNPDHLCTTARKKEIERGDIVWCTHHNEWVYVLDDEAGPARQMLCLFDTGQTQSIPIVYLRTMIAWISKGVH